MSLPSFAASSQNSRTLMPPIPLSASNFMML
jgi:hypothetical protein